MPTAILLKNPGETESSLASSLSSMISGKHILLHRLLPTCQRREASDRRCFSLGTKHMDSWTPWQCRRMSQQQLVRRCELGEGFLNESSALNLDDWVDAKWGEKDQAEEACLDLPPKVTVIWNVAHHPLAISYVQRCNDKCLITTSPKIKSVCACVCIPI